MANRKEASNSQIDLTLLSRSAAFGAVRNDTPMLRQEVIDQHWLEIPVSEYGTIISPFTKPQGHMLDGLNEYSAAQAIDVSGSLAVIGALEYLWDIRPLMRRVRQLLIEGRHVDVFIGFHGGYYTWSDETMREFLGAMGITVANTTEVAKGIARLTLSCTSSAYDDFLHHAQLPRNTFAHIIATTEHSAYRVTGGIGSYVKECDNLYGDDVAIVIIDDNETLDDEKVRAHRWITPQMFLGEDRVKILMSANYDTVGDVVQETLECVVALYSQLESIEAQEMLLNRSIDAKRLGMLPANVRLMTTCHGSSFHLAKAKRGVLDAENVHVAYREKYTLEHSDTVILPTEFLRYSYIDSGVEGLEDASRVKKRLPFDTSRLPKGENLEDYRRLLYIGKTSTIKGFDLFLETLLYLHENHPEGMKQIEEVVVMATSTDIAEPRLRRLFEEVKKRYTVRVISLDREVLLRTLAEYSRDTLALITYRGDNHPLAVLELMAIGHDFIAANAAGTPELILPGFEEHNLAPADTTAYAEVVYDSLKSAARRKQEVALLRKRYLEQQQDINMSYSIEQLRALPTHVSRSSSASKKSSPILVVVTIIGDKDSAGYHATRESVTAQNYQHIILSDTNQPAWYMRLYAGDILHSDAISTMVNLVESDDSVGAVLSDEIVMSFQGDGRKKGFEEYHPYAPELGSVFLQEKYNRRVVGLFRTQTAEELQYTDWQRCVAVASRRERVSVIPRQLMKLADIQGYFNDDVLDLSSKFSHSFTSLPVFDATILYSEMKRFDDLYWGMKLTNHLTDHFIHRDLVRGYEQVSPRVVRIIGIYNRFVPSSIRRGVSGVIDAAFAIARQMKHAVRKRE